MAYLIPSDLSQLALAGAHAPELDTLRQLEKGLPNDYTLFHGVHWTREYEAWNHFGEIDFVVLNRAGETLFIEQKNGVLDETESGLMKHYGDDSKNVANQIHRSIDKVRQKFQWQHGKNPSLHIDYLIHCPDYHIKELNAAGLDLGRIVDAAAGSSGLADRIQSVLGPGNVEGQGQDDAWYRTVHDFFCQTFEVVPDIHSHLSSNKKSFTRQAGILASVLTNLEMQPYRLRVDGCAGSGKSLIARHFFARAAADGQRVLLVCFNHPLAERLKARLPAEGRVSTIQALFVDFLESIGQAPSFDNADHDPDFWTKIQERAQNSILNTEKEQLPEQWRFDALIVDEGQDFEQEWLETLRVLLPDDADILWLEDPAQNIYAKPPIQMDGFVGYRCPVNYRSPESIARFIQDTLPFQFESGNPLPGMGVGVHRYDQPEDQAAIVANILKTLIQQRGFSPDDIVLLTCRGAGSSTFSKLDQVGGLRLRKFTGQYDDQGNQLMSDGQLRFDSVYRFKGQQAGAIILVDIDPRSDTGNERLEREQRLLLCGMTRATVRLDLVVNEHNPANHTFLAQ